MVQKWSWQLYDILKRQEMLYSNVPKCEPCGSDQVQLLVSTAVPAEWRCRKCKCKFEYEPESDNAEAKG